MPLVEIYQPEQRGTEWAVAAKINLPQGTIKILATAPQAMVATVLAKAAGLFAYHQGLAEVGAGGLSIDRQYVKAQPPSTRLSGPAIRAVLSPRFDSYKNKIITAMPYAGPALEAGIDEPSLKGAVAVAASTEPQPAPATTDPAVLAKAAAALAAANAALTATDGNADAAALMLASLKSALELLVQAVQGLEAAQDKIADIGAQAASGDAQGEEALAYLAAIYGYYCTPEQGYAEPSPEDYAGPDFEIDEDVAGRMRVRVGSDADVKVGARSTSDLLRRLDILSQVKAGDRF